MSKVCAGTVKTKNRKSAIHTGMLRVLEQTAEKGKTMDIRQKLVELLDKADVACLRTDCFEGCKFYSEKDDNCVNKLTADILITNGVTIQRWIPVTERLPEESGEYLAYCGKYDGICVLYYEISKTKRKWRTKWKEVTHWMPCPQPPKED